MTIKTTSPSAGSLRTEGPVGSPDEVENDDYRYLDIGLPQEIERLKQTGRIAAAREACLKLLEEVAEPQLRACLRAESHRMGRTARQFCVTRDRALELIRAEWPEFSSRQLDTFLASCVCRL